VRRIDPRVEAADHEEPQSGEDDGALVAARGGECAVAGQRDVDGPGLPCGSMVSVLI